MPLFHCSIEQLETTWMISTWALQQRDIMNLPNAVQCQHKTKEHQQSTFAQLRPASISLLLLEIAHHKLSSPFSQVQHGLFFCFTDSVFLGERLRCLSTWDFLGNWWFHQKKRYDHLELYDIVGVSKTCLKQPTFSVFSSVSSGHLFHGRKQWKTSQAAHDLEFVKKKLRKMVGESFALVESEQKNHNRSIFFGLDSNKTPFGEKTNNTSGK